MNLCIHVDVVGPVQHDLGDRDPPSQLRWARPVAARSDPGKDSSVDIPETRYAKTSEGVHIAYQIVGDGPIDLLYLPGYASNLYWQWELPSYARFLERLASFSRLILVDRRGTGLSDRFSPQDLPPLEELADDLETVMDAVGSERIALLGTEDGCFVCSMFAATHPTHDPDPQPPDLPNAC
jgi:hypothetical protein